jgi:DNA-binding XRE family transcriptional regulator
VPKSAGLSATVSGVVDPDRGRVYQPLTAAQLGRLMAGADEPRRWRLVAEFLEDYRWESPGARLLLEEEELAGHRLRAPRALLPVFSPTTVPGTVPPNAARQLAEMRKAAVLTQAELVNALGVSQARISKIEHGDISGIDIIRAYVSALGGTVDVVATVGERSWKVA